MSNATAPVFTRTVVHLFDMPCMIEPGDTTTARRSDVTCAACLSCMPNATGRCHHPRIFPTRRTERGGYAWNCICGYQTTRLLEGVPAPWFDIDTNRERLARIDQQWAS
jgi:hypothetical protein